MSTGQRLWTLRSINGQPFGCDQAGLVAALGPPDTVRQNFDGEFELHYGDGPTIYRCSPHGQFVEASFGDRGDLTVDGVHILSVFDWLAERDDVVDMARFRISLANGIAYDYRNPDYGSITVFGPGHWDALVLGPHGP